MQLAHVQHLQQDDSAWLERTSDLRDEVDRVGILDEARHASIAAVDPGRRKAGVVSSRKGQKDRSKNRLQVEVVVRTGKDEQMRDQSAVGSDDAQACAHAGMPSSRS